MSWSKGDLSYEGKAKRIFEVSGHPELCWLEYKDSLTAFNAQKKGSFAGKGQVNCEISTLVFRLLSQLEGVSTHLKAVVSPVDVVCQRVNIVPLEVVVRNRLAGSTAKKFGWEEGRALEKPLVEFYFKDDALQDPFLSDDQALVIGAVKERSELDDLRAFALQVNRGLKKIFSEVGIELIDFKVEFGRTPSGQLVLADEISPDSCRLWDLKSGEKMDKDRFRRDLGQVEESYREVLNRLNARWKGEV